MALFAACKKPTSSVQNVAFSPSEKYVVDPSTLFHFQNLSEGVYTNYWTFGDGTSSREQHPSHIYHSKGEFTIKLRVTSAELEDFITENKVIIGDIKAEAFEVDAFPNVMRFVGDDSVYANSRSVQLKMKVTKPTTSQSYSLFEKSDNPKQDFEINKLNRSIELYPGDSVSFTYHLQIANIWQGIPFWFSIPIASFLWQSEPIVVRSLQPEDVEVALKLKSEEIDDSFKVRFHHEVKYEPKEE